MPMPKNRLSATSAAFGDGGIHTQWPKIIAKLFITASLMTVSFASPRTAFERRFADSTARPGNGM
jgi:hypothetical protein